MTEIIPPSYEQYLENSDFPIGATPTLNFYANPSAIVGGISRGIVVDTLDQITMLLSGETIPNIVNISRNGMGTFNVTVFDSFLPKYLVMIMLFPLAAVAILILKEKESNTLQFVESTYTQNITHMTSIEITQFCLAVFQATIYLSLFKLFGFFFNPLGDLSCLIFTLALLSLISTNIGLIIGNIARSYSVAIGLSVLFILLFEFLGGSFFDVSASMGQFIPTFFANKIVSDIMIDGKGWFFLQTSLWILVLFYAVTFILVLISMRLRQHFKAN